MPTKVFSTPGDFTWSPPLGVSQVRASVMNGGASHPSWGCQGGALVTIDSDVFFGTDCELTVAITQEPDSANSNGHISTFWNGRFAENGFINVYGSLCTNQEQDGPATAIDPPNQLANAYTFQGPNATLVSAYLGGYGTVAGGGGSSAGTSSNGNSASGTTGGAAPVGGGKGGNNAQAGSAPGGGGGKNANGASGRVTLEWTAWNPFTILGASPYATAVGGNWTGSTVDFDLSETMECWAVQNVGDFEESGTMNNRIVESDTGLDGSWTDIPGATFAEVTGGNQTELIKFTRTKRYLRGAGNVTGSDVLITFNIVIGDESLPDQTFGDVLNALLYTTAHGADWSGPVVDFNASPTTDCWALWNMGDIEESPIIDGKIQESTTGLDGSWTDIPGVTFGPFDSANHVQAFTFTRTKRYLRATGALSGSGALVTFGIAVGDLVEPAPPPSGGIASCPLRLGLGLGL